MEHSLDDDARAAVAAVIRDALIEGHSMSVPGLGTFRVTHEPSRINQRHDGSEEMLPPRDVVAFETDVNS